MCTPPQKEFSSTVRTRWNLEIALILDVDRGEAGASAWAELIHVRGVAAQHRTTTGPPPLTTRLKWLESNPNRTNRGNRTGLNSRLWSSRLWVGAQTVRKQEGGVTLTV